MPARRLKHRVYQIVEVARKGDHASKLFDNTIIALILITVGLTVLETVESLQISWGWAFITIEAVASAIFIIEYGLRVWSCTSSDEYTGIRGRLRFMLTPMMIIDLIALVPSVLLFAQTEVAALRAIRLLRLVRLARLTRYSRALRLVGGVLRAKSEELATTLAILLVLLLVAASLMYYAEHEAQPEAFSSIPASMWWGVATLTTVGYGDVYPVTPLGRLLAAVMAILGIGLFALPAGLMGSGFMEAMEKLRKEDEQRDAAAGVARPAASNAAPSSETPPAATSADGQPTGPAEPSPCPHCGRPMGDHP